MSVTPNEASQTDSLAQSFLYGSSMFDSIVHQQKIHHAYLFGFPILHSLSPLLHSSLFDGARVPWTFALVESLQKADMVSKLRRPSCIGCAITMPHKITFMAELDAVTEEASMIGAVNTVFKRRDSHGHTKLIGTNTDCIGIREAFLQNHLDVLTRSSGRPALVIGGGGTCRSAVYTLWRWMGASKIYVVGRLREEIDEVIASFQAVPDFTCELIRVETVEHARTLESPALIVSAVPDIEPKTHEEILARSVVTTFLGKKTKGIVLEMCYHPHPVTAFFELAQEHGWEVISGIEAMIHQGVAQQVLWLERPRSDFNTLEAVRVIRKAISPSAML